MFHEIRLRVRYAETDRMGIAHHSNHVIWWEMGRTALFREIDLPYSWIEAQGIACPLVKICVIIVIQLIMMMNDS